MQPTYPTFDLAARRVDALRRSGYWPGVVTREDGRYQLTFDPDARPSADSW